MRRETRSVPVPVLGWDTVTSPSGLPTSHAGPPRRPRTKMTQAENRDRLWCICAKLKEEWHKGKAGGSWIVAPSWVGPR